jgi:nitrogen fixation NifU-like protein
MSDLRDLYQEVILDHNRRPRNFRALDTASHTAEGYNPLCGDRLTVYLRINSGIIEEVSFLGSGCAISKASASLMTDMLRGKSVAEADDLFNRFHELVTSPTDSPANVDRLGKLAVFAGVREYPVRVKCASLPWHTVRAAVEHKAAVVSTE